MSIEEYNRQRLFVIAQMAATLEAGDRAAVVFDGTNHLHGYICEPKDYAARAVELFAAAEEVAG